MVMKKRKTVYGRFGIGFLRSKSEQLLINVESIKGIRALFFLDEREKTSGKEQEEDDCRTKVRNFNRFCLTTSIVSTVNFMSKSFKSVLNEKRCSIGRLVEQAVGEMRRNVLPRASRKDE